MSQIPDQWIRQVAEEVARRLGPGNVSSDAGTQSPPSGYGVTPGGAHSTAGGYGATSGGTRATSSGYGAAQSGGTQTPSGYDAPCCTGASCCKIPGFESGSNPDRMQILKEHGVARIGCHPGIGRVDAELAHMLDHTILKPDATEKQIIALCEEAHCYGFATVCIQPIWVPLAARVLEASRAKVCTVVGFPHGANRAEVKAYETQVAVGQGAREIDMVIPIGAMKSGDTRTVTEHVRAVVRASIAGVIVKVILENTYLTDDEKRAACIICRDEGAHFVKTSTGFGPSGATLDDIRLMREVVGPTLGVKAAGGIRDTAAARAMIAAGATRIGASASVQIASS